MSYIIRFKPLGAAGSVAGIMLEDAAVTEIKLAINAVTKDKIKDGEVTEIKVVTEAFVLAHKGSGISKVLQSGYDAATNEIVLVIRQSANI